jgi:hypothetical protein
MPESGAKHVIPAVRRLRQEDCEFETSLGYMVRAYLKTKKSLRLGSKI